MRQVLAAAAAIAVGFGIQPSSAASMLRPRSATCRDKLAWPFAATSIWNMPIGSGADFQAANIFGPNMPQPGNFHHDDDHVWIQMSDEDPATPWYDQGGWGEHPVTEYCVVKGPFYRNISIPANFTLTLYGHNNAAGLLYPDQETFTQTQPVYRCAVGSPFLSLKPFCRENMTVGVNCTMSVRGNGTYGAHGGSGLSAVGGAIRVAEVGPSAPPISHALKIELSALDYYYDKPPALVWPAIQHDGYAFNTSNRLHYGGSNPNLAPGSLLAVPTSVAVNTTTVPGKRILDALTGYGGYIVDDTAANRGTLCAEYGFGDAFFAAYGFQFNQTSGAFKDDMTRVFQALHIVTNNAPDSVGGGGTPIRPLAPPFCD